MRNQTDLNEALCIQESINKQSVLIARINEYKYSLSDKENMLPDFPLVNFDVFNSEKSKTSIRNYIMLLSEIVKSQLHEEIVISSIKLKRISSYDTSKV